jgi:hypothetical protein
MKKIITGILLYIILSSTNIFGQSSLSNFELRMENGQLSSPSSYQFDVYLYNTSVSAFELRAGTVSFWINASWRNGGTITPSITSSNLVTAQQSGTSAYTNGSTDFFRRTIANVASGAGTSIAAGSRTKLFTITFSNSASFSNSATPNFAWKFSGTNSCGFTYTDTTTTASAVAVNATTVVATQSNCYTPAYWTGTQWNSGSSSAAVASTTAPTTSKDAVIYTGTFNGALSCRNYYLSPSTTHNLGSSTLEVSYNLTNSGTLSASTGTLNLVGTQIAQTNNQSLAGNSIAVQNLGFGVASNGGTKSLSANVSVSGTLTQSGTSVLSSGGKLSLLSNASGTASVAEVSSGAISGNITVERYLPASFRRYRFLSSPVVGGTTLQWRDNGATNANRGIQITHPSGTADPSVSNAASAFKFTESLVTGGSNINAKWESIDGNTALQNGSGYRVWVRGDRTRTLLTNLDTVANNTTIWVSGTYPNSPVSLPITYNPGLGEGWNLVGNPFPSAIDWNAASGWTKTNIGNTIYIWNPLTNTFGSFDGTTEINSVTRYIASGQAFFVQATGPAPELTATESVKVASTPSNMFKGPELNCLRISLYMDTTEKDETVIRFLDNKSDNFIKNEDVLKYNNPSINVGSYISKNLYAMVNYLNINSLSDKLVPLQVSSNVNGQYTLSFKQVSDFNSDIYLYLKDNFTNTNTNLRNTNKYTFQITSDSNSKADGRFQVIFSNKAMSIEKLRSEPIPLLTIYPNPAKDILYLNIVDEHFKTASISVFNSAGSLVYSALTPNKNNELQVQDLENGIYLIQVENTETGKILFSKFVK